MQGHYEVYAVAIDDDGNRVVSNVERIIVEEPSDSIGEPLQLQVADSVYTGSTLTVNASYVSPEGIYSYHSDLQATVFINGTYVGIADRYPYPTKALGRRPRISFFLRFQCGRNGYKEVEFVIVDGNLTYSAKKTIEPKRSPYTDDYEFLKFVYTYFDRDPQGTEISAYISALKWFSD